MADTKTRTAGAVEYVKGDWGKATYTDNPHIDNLMHTVQSLGAELWAMRRRMFVLEKYLDEKNVALKAQVEAYQPTDAENVAWDKARDEYIRRVFDGLTQTRAKVGGPVPTGKSAPINRL